MDEKNLKRAVHRYGTMPKGDRIGAYLESLRQSGMTPEPVTESGVESDASLMESSLGQSGASSQDNTLERPNSSCQGAPRAVVAQHHQQMLRSNSSHGGFGSSRASPRTNPTHLRRNLASNPSPWSPVSGMPQRTYCNKLVLTKTSFQIHLNEVPWHTVMEKQTCHPRHQTCQGQSLRQEPEHEGCKVNIAAH